MPIIILNTIYGLYPTQSGGKSLFYPHFMDEEIDV